MKRFKIDHIDPLGQGVFKENEDIYFIPKTLPNEEGTFEVHKSKKKIHFADVTELTTPSQERIVPECPHFNLCMSCQFLHTSYDQELQFKTNTFERKFSYLPQADNTKSNIIPAIRRFEYRNRVQLHYDKKQKRIGFINSRLKEIIEVPECQIMDKQVASAFQKLIVNNSWLKLVKNAPNTGHIEIYNSAEGVKLSVNKAYSAGGFTQVFKEMNTQMQTHLKSLQASNGFILDLFGGNGNLSEGLNYTNRLIIDLYSHQGLKGQKFSGNLFKPEALTSFTDTCSNLLPESLPLMLIDPPRAGFKDIKQWVDYFQPSEIIYVSCHIDTMVRDLKQISSDYTIAEKTMVDLFPSTYHFEAITRLTKI